MQNIITEYDLINIIHVKLGKEQSNIRVTKRFSDYLENTEIEVLSYILSEMYNFTDKDIASYSILDVVDILNNIKGLNQLTIRALLSEIWELSPESVAITFDDNEITYGELKKKVLKLGNSLHTLGLNKGDRVAIILENSLEYIYLYFALFYIGVLPVPINTRWSKEEVFNVLKDAECKIICCENKINNREYGKYIYEYCKSDEVLKVLCYGENIYFDKNGMILQELIYKGSESELDIQIEPNDAAILSYTSGTTGLPKGVILKNNDIVKISCYTTSIWSDKELEYPLSIAPLYSAQGFLSLFINYSLGKHFKMLSTFAPNDILQEISKKENTIIHTQPTMWNLLLNCRIINFTRFDFLNKLVVSGSVCSPELAKKIEKTMNCILLNAYGLIEATSVVTMTRITDPEEIRLNTVGKPIPGVKIKIVDSNRREIRKGEVGELAVKGYNMLGYYRKEELTNEVIDQEGWLYTGDLAKYYDDENIAIVGRCKDMIIRGGFNVYPIDVEEAILRIEGIQNVAVVGKKNRILGEEIVAFVLPKPGAEISINEIRRYLFKHLANYKMPDKIYFVSEIPIILAGKIDKKELSKWAELGIPNDKKIMFKGEKNEIN